VNTSIHTWHEKEVGKKMVVIVQICPKEVIENKLLPKAKGHS